METTEFERLETILNSLRPALKDMNEKSSQFVRDQIERVDQYGINVRMSPKQLSWLESLYEKHVGKKLKDPKKDDRRDTLEKKDDIDDEIPF
jgi:hypothetical protein